MKIHGFDKYRISDCGKVYNSKSERFLKLKQDKHTGYLYVTLYKAGRQISLRIHRLVFDAFGGLIPSNMVVNHIDGNKQNNCISNLEITTHKENAQHALRLGLKKNVKKVYSKDSDGSLYEYTSAAEAGREIGVSPHTIRRAIIQKRIFKDRLFFYKK